MSNRNRSGVTDNKGPEPRARDFGLKAVSVRRAHLGGRQLHLTIPVAWLKHHFDQLPTDPVGEIEVSLDDRNRLILEPKPYKAKVATKPKPSEENSGE